MARAPQVHCRVISIRERHVVTLTGGQRVVAGRSEAGADGRLERYPRQALLITARTTGHTRLGGRDESDTGRSELQAKPPSSRALDDFESMRGLAVAVI